jgi:hypothetical protein
MPAWIETAFVIVLVKRCRTVAVGAQAQNRRRNSRWVTDWCGADCLV